MRFVAPVAALVALVAPSLAAAQAWPAEQLRAHVVGCLDHDANHRRAAAIDCWRTARAHSDSPRVMYGFARALRAAARYREASRELRGALNGMAADPAMAEQAVEARRALRDMADAMGRLALVTTPPGARVTVDGEEIPPAERPIALDPGAPHTLVVEAPDHAPVTRTVVVHGGLATGLEVALTRLAVVGRIHVEATPEGASIEVDGRPVGHGRVDEPLPAGSHRLRVTALGHRAFERDVEVPRGETARLRVELADERPVTSRTWFRVAVGVAAAAVVAGAVVAAVALRPDEDPYPHALFNVPPN